ncbi:MULTISPECIES: helix-turn-helix domain-containing protein [unclassified Halorubrum]|uniref:winged helix-turn-helix transcriptional regulator n=1 Tax=unclassified Halorubrum TaxID=2642239 RepID=UPI000B97F4A7|nr:MULTISPECIES: helix-turn-helix domain-containing protein [unclassified Halorubrum]OYR43370.1 transcriptional regulator [Halorubrum sp. Eb13]OYR51254.1 transcriptional regulator [Halorubrum sp. Ea1]OYR52158.1 transcriptional regulator [Halorubrum sp. Ea8]
MSSQDLAGSDPAETTETQAETGDASAPDTPCPVVDSLEQIGSRWRLVVLHELLNGESRFNELKRETDANARTLSRVLDDLQETGFVDRRLEEESPVATYYSLTPKGESLAPVFEEIDDWAHEWLAECSG